MHRTAHQGPVQHLQVLNHCRGWRENGRYPRKPVKEAVVPTGWWKAKQEAARRPHSRKLPEETLRARRMGVKIGDARARAKRDGITVSAALDAIGADLRAEAEKQARETRERLELAPAYASRVAAPLIGDLDAGTRVSRALETLHVINRMAKDPRWKTIADRIYRAKDRLVMPLLRSGLGKVYRFEQPARLGFCCGRGPIRTGERCWACGWSVTGRPEVWGVAHFTDALRTYRWHLPPWKLAPELLGLSEETEPHDPRQPVRAVPPLELELESAIALVAHVGDLVSARLQQNHELSVPAVLAGGAEASS